MLHSRVNSKHLLIVGLLASVVLASAPAADAGMRIKIGQASAVANAAKRQFSDRSVNPTSSTLPKEAPAAKASVERPAAMDQAPAKAASPPEQFKSAVAPLPEGGKTLICLAGCGYR